MIPEASDLPHCPICRRGVLYEWTAGVYCSRRYAKRAPCAFEAPLCDSLDQWTTWVQRYRQKLAAGARARLSSSS